MSDATIPHPPIVSQEEWLAERKKLLAHEKELTKEYDRENAQRRRLPMVKLEKSYQFHGPNGTRSLQDLFEGQTQLIVYHFMFDPAWEKGCPGCTSFINALGDLSLLQKRSTNFVVISRAPLEKLEAYKTQMGWDIAWYSSFGSDFNYDFHVSFTPEQLANGQVTYNFRALDVSGGNGMQELSGLSIFFKDEAGTVYHTYSAYARGDERLVGAYMLLDLTPNGRNEHGPNGNLTDWVRRHDEYADQHQTQSCCAA